MSDPKPMTEQFLVDGGKLKKIIQIWLDEGDCGDETHNTLCQIRDELLEDKEIRVPIQHPDRIRGMVGFFEDPKRANFTAFGIELADLLRFILGEGPEEGQNTWTEKDFGLEGE